jgi:hypothetical protein
MRDINPEDIDRLVAIRGTHYVPCLPPDDDEKSRSQSAIAQRFRLSAKGCSH